VINEDKWDQDGHARDQEKTDQFNRLCDDVIQTKGGLRAKLEQLANSDSAEVNAILEEHGITNPRVPQKFHLSNGQRAAVWLDNSGWHAAAIFDGQQINFAADSRDGAMLACENHLQKNLEPHELSESELLRVAHMVQSGQTVSALELYVQLSLGKKVEDESASAVLENPKYRSVLNKAAFTVWTYSRQDYCPNNEFIDVLNEVAASKPLTTAVIDSLYDKFCDDRAHLVRSARRTAEPASPENGPVTQDDLEKLSSVEIAKLRTATLLERARRVRQFNRESLGADQE
jgi:hypothetical protein